MGLFGGRELKKRKKKFRWKKTKFKVRALNLKRRKDPMEGAPMAKGIVLAKRAIEQKQPHSGLIKVVRVQLLKNKREITVFVPKDGGIKHINEHDEVLIDGMGGSGGGPVGSQHGLRWKVIKVNNISLEELRKGKKTKVGVK